MAAIIGGERGFRPLIDMYLGSGRSLDHAWAVMVDALVSYAALEEEAADDSSPF
jgi:hypothetical protein